MSLGPRPNPARGALDLPTFDDGDETLILPVTGVPPSTSWWRDRRAVAIVAAALLLLIVVGIIATLLLNRPSGPTLQYQRAGLGNLELSVSATGPVQSGVYSITFSGSAKLATIAVKVGDSVTAGETVATLDATSLQDAVNQAQAAVSAAQTALDNAQTNAAQVAAQTQANLQAAYDQEQQAIQACNTPTPTPTTTTTTAPHSTFNPTPTPTPAATATGGNSTCIQRAEDQYTAAQAQANAQDATAQAQVNTAQAQLNTANAQLQTAEDNLNNATLTAPHDGTVSQVNGVVGETPGLNFIQIVDLTSLQILANVNEADIGVVAPGQPVRFSVSAYGSRQFSGTVDAIAPVGQSVANVVTFPVTINIDAASANGAHLFPGMTATVTIITAQRFQVVLVPVRAVSFARDAATKTNGFITPAQAQQAIAQAQILLTQLENSGTDVSNDTPTTAYLLERAKGKWVVRPVVLGLTDGTSYEVLSGLTAGDTIVVGAQR